MFLHYGDLTDANALAAPFGLAFEGGILSASEAGLEGQSPLVDGVTALDLVGGNAVPISLAGAEGVRVLARAGGEPVAALVDHGRGEVLVLADVGILGADGGGPDNLPFWRNLARYARR